MGFRWRYESSDGVELAPSALPAEATTETFPNQGDAESWVGETWRELLAGGIEQVSLLEDGRLVYGPMSLNPE